LEVKGLRAAKETLENEKRPPLARWPFEKA